MHKTKAQREANRIWSSRNCPVPVPIESILDDHKVELQLADLEEGVSGMMVTREDQQVIVVVNSHHHSTRQRFTMAHELGHYMLHRGTCPVFVDGRTFFRDGTASEGTRIQEIEANAFAAELLMPEEEVRKLVSDNLTVMDESELCQLADKFDVSPAAMSVRLMRLGLLEDS